MSAETTAQKPKRAPRKRKEEAPLLPPALTPIAAELRSAEAERALEVSLAASPIEVQMPAPQIKLTAEQRMKADFRVFLFAIWKHLGLPKPTPIQYDIAHYLQHGPRRCIIEAFRGIGKSWITAAFAVWLLYGNPDLKIEVVSASKTLADQFSTFALRLIQEVPFLMHLAPDKSAGQHSSKIMFDVGPAKTSKDPSVKSVGITGQITGSRADVLIADDVETPGNSMTQGQRDKLSELVKEFDAVLKPGGRIIYLGTPQTEQSLYLTLATRGYEVRIWPVRYPSPEKLTGLYGDRLAPYVRAKLDADPSLAGKTTEPLRFTDVDLLEREASYGKAGFALQFMLDTTLSDADLYPLKLHDLLVMPLDTERAPASVAWGASAECLIHDLEQIGLNGDRWYRPIFADREWVPYTGSVMFIDPSGRGKDETSWAVVKMLFGFLYLAEVGGTLKGYDDETLQAIADCAKRHKVNMIRVEPNFGDGMFTKLLMPFLRKTHPCTVEEVRSVGQKEKRVIDVLEPVMMQHKLIVAEQVVREDQRERYRDLSPEQQLKYRLFYQLTRITKEKGALAHDDRVEAVAGAVAYWVEQMAADHKAQVDQHREEELRKALEDFRSHVMGLGEGASAGLSAFDDILG